MYKLRPTRKTKEKGEQNYMDFVSSVKAKYPFMIKADENGKEHIITDYIWELSECTLKSMYFGKWDNAIIKDNIRRALAEKKNDWLWRLVFFGLPLAKLELVYIEYFIIKARSESEPSVIQKIRGKLGKKVVKTFDILFNEPLNTTSLNLYSLILPTGNKN